ncbi:hypothetical protein D3C79_901160 [compost metagenome]
MLPLLGDFLSRRANLLLELLLLPQLFPGTFCLFLFLLLLDLEFMSKVKLIKLEIEVDARYLYAHDLAKSIASFKRFEDSLLAELDVVKFHVRHAGISFVVERANHQLDHVVDQLTALGLAVIHRPVHVAGGRLPILDQDFLTITDVIQSSLVFLAAD